MWEDILICPVCGSNEMISPSGPSKSSVLIIGEAPGEEEIKHARSFVGRTGTVLRTELARFGIDLSQIRLTNMWLHPKTENSDCFKHCFTKAIEQAKDRKAVLLIGAGTVKKFCNHGVEEFNGLLVKSPFLSAPFVMASIQPAIVWNENGVIGEVRLVMRNFSKILIEEKIL